MREFQIYPSNLRRDKKDTEQSKIHLRWRGLESPEILRIFTLESAIRGTQRLFSVKYLFREAKIA